jgi:hypothetical protein
VRLTPGSVPSGIRQRPVTVPINLHRAKPPLPLLSRTSVVRTRLLFLVVLFALAAIPLSAGTKIVRRWVVTDEPMPKIEKILVIAVLENYLIRQEFEDEMERLLADSGVQGIRSHMVLPPRNELMEGELKERIKEGDFDSVLVIRPMTVRKETEEVVTSVSGPYFVPPTPYYHFWPYWNMAWGQVHATSSYLKENTIVNAEFNLYSTKDEKLLWSGETETVYSKDFGKLAKTYAKTLVKQLKKDKVVGTK